MAINYTTLATGALGFTAALAWNDAVLKTVWRFSPGRDEKSAGVSVVRAAVVTALVILIVVCINSARKFIHEAFGGGREPMRDGSDRALRGAPPLPAVVRLWEPRGALTRAAVAP